MKSRVSSLLVLILLLLFFPALAEENYVIAQPGDSGVDVQIVLAKCSELGFLKNLPANERNYIEKYSSGIKEMEKVLGFTADGIIRLDEFEEIETAIGPGSQGDTVKEVLERLFDLGYIKEALPNKHVKYEEKYQDIIKNAEKKLGLTADGIMTESELGRLRKESFAALQNVRNVNAKYANGGVTVSWGAVNGASRYILYRNSREIATVYGKTSWEDYDLEMGCNYNYHVKAESYYRSSEPSDRKQIAIPFIEKITFVDKTHKYNMTFTHGSPAGKAQSIRYTTLNELQKGTVRIHSVTQQKLNNSYTRFTMTFSAPQGFGVYIFNPPNGSRYMYESKGSTSSNIEIIRFDISDSNLKAGSYDLSINIFKAENNRFWVFPEPVKPN